MVRPLAERMKNLEAPAATAIQPMNSALTTVKNAAPERDCVAACRHGELMMSGLKARAGLAVLFAVLLCGAWPALAQQDSAVLFRNVRIFDGKNAALSAASNVLVRDRKIERI